MENMFKKLLYTGVGVASQAKDKIEETVKNLVDDDKMSYSEGKRIVDEFLDTTNSKKDDAENEMNNIVERMVKAFRFANKQDLDALTDRVSALEALIAKMETKSLPAKEEPVAELAETTETTEPAAETTEDTKKPAAKRRSTRSKKTEE